MNGADWLLDALAAEGVRYLFGNPGSTELPLIEALGRHDRIDYVLCLHEAAALGMADGYAQASGELTAVNVHVQPGMANALSGILNARRARVPMLVTVGQQVTQLLDHAPFLGGDVLGMARPFARGYEPRSAMELARDFHAAVTDARSAPMGPSVLSIPLDLQAAPAPPAHRAASPPRSVGPTAGEIDSAVAVMNSAARPAILAGDGVVHSGACDALVRVIESLGAPLFGEPFAARAPISTDHPLWRGPLPGFGSEIREALADHDVLLAVGMPVFRLFGISPGDALSSQTRLMHVDVDLEELGRSFETETQICCDPRAFLEALADELPPAVPPAAVRQTKRPHLPTATITPKVFAWELADIVEPADIVVDETLTAGRDLRRALAPRTSDNWFAHRGSALGWGLPAAVGIALAKPDRRVLVAHGDGSVLFGLSALWTAAHLRLPLAMVIADNGGYEILRAGLEGMTGAASGAWPGLELVDPRLDFEALCSGFGADVESASTSSELRDGLRRLWSRAKDGPAVLVAQVAGQTAPVGYPLV